MQSARARNIASKVVMYVVLIIMAFIMLVPFVWMILFRVICACLTATMAGYAFGRLKFPLKNFFFALVLVQMMIPAQIFIIPQYLMVSSLGLLNTVTGLVFPGIVTAFGTYLLKTGYEGLPKDLER